MLVAMTFNVGIFLSMLGGMAIGFLTLGRYLDVSVPPRKNVSGCECDDDFSCGCHKGQSCACCVASQLNPTSAKANIGSQHPLGGHSGSYNAYDAVCGKPEHVVV